MNTLRHQFNWLCDGQISHIVTEILGNEIDNLEAFLQHQGRADVVKELNEWSADCDTYYSTHSGGNFEGYGHVLEPRRDTCPVPDMAVPWKVTAHGLLWGPNQAEGDYISRDELNTTSTVLGDPHWFWSDPGELKEGGYISVFRICINLIQIWIHHFKLNTDPDPRFSWPKIEKKITAKEK